jgi:small subunit ribosomal protein S21
LEVVIKIEVKDNNIEQALRVLKRKLQRDGFFKVIKLKILMKNLQKRKKEYSKKTLKELKN